MPYIGKAPVSGGFHKLDSLTASATATYALTLDSAAYYPETANHLLVSLNGVIQAPQDSFTVSGSNLIFDSALTASDSIDFVVALGDVLGVGSVSDGAITTAKIGNNAVTDAKIDTMAASKLTGALPAIDGSALTGLSATSVAVIADQKAASTVGGGATSGSWQTRDLNTEIHDPDSIVSISSNQFTLGAGEYLIQFSAPAFKVNTHQTRLYNATSASVVALGKSAYGADGRDIQQDSTGSGYVSLTANATFEIQHQVQTTKATNGFGNSVSWGNNIYTLVTIFKVG